MNQARPYEVGQYYTLEEIKPTKRIISKNFFLFILIYLLKSSFSIIIPNLGYYRPILGKY